MLTEYKRGDIVRVNFEISDGSIQGGTRPALITQNDKGNFYSPVLLVAPITSKRKTNIPTHMNIDESCGLKRTSTVLFEQTRPVNKSQVIEYIGHIEMNKMVEIKILIAYGCLSFLGEDFRNVVCLANK